MNSQRLGFEYWGLTEFQDGMRACRRKPRSTCDSITSEWAQNWDFSIKVGGFTLCYVAT